MDINGSVCVPQFVSAIPEFVYNFNDSKTPSKVPQF